MTVVATMKSADPAGAAAEQIINALHAACRLDENLFQELSGVAAAAESTLTGATATVDDAKSFVTGRRIEASEISDDLDKELKQKKAEIQKRQELNQDIDNSLKRQEELSNAIAALQTKPTPAAAPTHAIPTATSASHNGGPPPQPLQQPPQPMAQQPPQGSFQPIPAYSLPPPPPQGFGGYSHPPYNYAHPAAPYPQHPYPPQPVHYPPYPPQPGQYSPQPQYPPQPGQYPQQPQYPPQPQYAPQHPPYYAQPTPQPPQFGP